MEPIKPIRYNLTPNLVRILKDITMHHTYVRTLLSVSKQKASILRGLQASEIFSSLEIDTPRQRVYDKRKEALTYAVKEQNAYRDALLFLTRQASQKVNFDEKLLLKIHKLISVSRDGGRFRSAQTFIMRMPAQEVIHKPPPPIHVPPAVHSLFRWLSDNSSIDPVICSAVVHHQIAYIHPFLDGNGRVARLAASYLMMIGGYSINHTMISSAQFFLSDRARYFEELQKVNKADDYNSWIEYIAEAWRESFAHISQLVSDLHKNKTTPHHISVHQNKLINFYRHLGVRAMVSTPISPKVPLISKEVFIIMAMVKGDPTLDDVHETIKTVCKKNGLKAYRVDDVGDTNKITDKIRESIDSSLFVVADLTHERPNAYYEVGYTHGIDKRVIFTAKEGTTLHFDIKDFHVIFYSNMTTLRQKLDVKIKAVLKELL